MDPLSVQNDEILRRDGPKVSAIISDRSDPPKGFASPLRALLEWGAPRTETADGRQLRAKQIVAFSDPSDLLTSRVPELGPVTVVNIYDRNQSSFLGLVANPCRRMQDIWRNSDVCRVLMRRSGKDNGK